MRFRIIAFFTFLPLLAAAQSGLTAVQPVSKIEYYLQAYSHADGYSPSPHVVLSFVDKMAGKRQSFKRDKDFLEYLFVKTHQRFLKHYVDYPSFGEMLTKGTYNCLTGTALYALLLDHLGIEYQVIETNYHIFLLAYTDQSRVLFETTDPLHGFVSDASAIETRIAQYRENSIEKLNTSKTLYRYNFDLYNVVNLDEVLGLLHYNLSIAAYNRQQLPVAVHELGKAIELYQSPRIQEFSRIVLLSIMVSDLAPSVREGCLQRIQAIRKKQMDVTARVP